MIDIHEHFSQFQILLDKAGKKDYRSRQRYWQSFGQIKKYQQEAK